MGFVCLPSAMRTAFCSSGTDSFSRAAQRPVRVRADGCPPFPGLAAAAGLGPTGIVPGLGIRHPDVRSNGHPFEVCGRIHRRFRQRCARGGRLAMRPSGITETVRWGRGAPQLATRQAVRRNSSSSACTRLITLPQSSAADWRSRRAVGYQGVLSRSCIQRQSER